VPEPAVVAAAAPADTASGAAPAPTATSFPELAQPALVYTATATDGASQLQVQMVLHMDRMPHRWQAVYSSPGPNPITYEQYSLLKAMHVELDQALGRLLRAAAWQEATPECWIAPWEADGAS
jgi:hypothetical protein